MSESELSRAERRRQERAGKSAASKIQAASEANETGLTSPVLSEWLKRLRSLPVDAAEWRDAPVFTAAMMCIHAEKLAEHVLALEEAFREELEETAASFSDELRYLEIDISTWPADMATRPWIVPQAQALAPKLRSALEAYHEVRPQASTRTEEEQRASQRTQWEQDIAAILDRWNELRNPVDPALDPQELIGADEPPVPSFAEYADLQMQISNLKQKYAKARSAIDKRTEERDAARAEAKALQIQIASLERQRGVDGPPSADAGDTARLADTTGSEPQVRNVRDAIAVAKDRFPGTLTIAPNSASENDTPFQRPDEVYAALEWLATEYYELHTNPQGADPREFDRRLKEACPGWSYTSKQSDTAKNKFKVEYKTTVDERTYTLDEHVGKGTKGDPQYMIRIAFAWDEDIKKVVVGYIGRHQRTQAS